MPTYHLDILVNGKDNASGVLHGISGALGGLGTAALALTAGGLAALGGILGAATSAAMDFESTMSGVQAVLSPTAEEMDALSAKALQLGKDTNFGASEAAAGIEMLAKNGLSATDILNGAADATLALAAATGLEGGEGLATAADIATNAMSVFGIQARDMTRAINGITAVTVASQFDIEDYELALAQAGGTARAAGVEFDDFNTAIAAISPMFASGSDAGTSFKTLLQRLVPVSGPAAEALQRLGIITEDGANKFFDASGHMRSMAEVAQVLQDAMRGLSEQEAIDLFTQAFGTDAQRAAFALAQTGATGFAQLAASMREVDAAAQAATRLDNLSGDLQQLQGSLETAGIQLGSSFTPLLRGLVQVATDFVNTHLVDRDWTPLVNGVSGAIDAVRGLVDTASHLLQGARDLVSEGPPLTALFSDLSEPVGRVADGLGRLRDAVQPVVDGIKEGGLKGALAALPSVIAPAGEALFRLRQDVLGLAGEGLGQLFDRLSDSSSFRSFLSDLGLSDSTIDALTGTLKNFGEIARQAAGLAQGVAAQIKNLIGPVTESAASFGEMLAPHLEWFSGFAAEKLLPALRDVVNWVGPQLEGALKVVTPLAKGLVDIGLSIVELALKAIAATWDTYLKPALEQLGKWLEDLTGGWSNLERGAKAVGKTMAAIAQAIRDIAEGKVTFADLSRGLSNLFSGNIQIPGLASGGQVVRGGLAVVGERGPELLNLPPGADVLPLSLLPNRSIVPGTPSGSTITSITVGQLVVQGVNDPAETARAVRRELLRMQRATNLGFVS